MIDTIADLPELPMQWACSGNDPVWNASQMRDYARAALALAQPAGEAVFYAMPRLIENCHAIASVQHRHRVMLSTEQEDGYTVPLYTARPVAAGEARDAARWRCLRAKVDQASDNDDTDLTLEGEWIIAGDALDEWIDAALTQEQPNG